MCAVWMCIRFRGSNSFMSLSNVVFTVVVSWTITLRSIDEQSLTFACRLAYLGKWKQEIAIKGKINRKMW